MAELRNIKWGKFCKTLFKREYFKALLKSRSLQWWLTLGLRDNGYVILDDLETLTLEYKGVKFYPDVYNYARMFEAWDRYRIEGVRKGDTVLDLGANIGSFTLPAAKVAKRVVAVEPIFHELLKRNIELNSLENVNVVPCAIGTNLADAGLTVPFRVEEISLTKILEKVGEKIDVIRMDIGGAEWNFHQPLDYLWEGVRQWEIEFHFYEDRKGDWNSWKNWLEEIGYGYIARWSKHRHWLYLSADKELEVRKEVQLTDGSFRGGSLEKWKSQVIT